MLSFLLALHQANNGTFPSAQAATAAAASAVEQLLLLLPALAFACENAIEFVDHGKINLGREHSRGDLISKIVGL